MDILNEYSKEFDTYLGNNPLTKEPKQLYEPADYILSLGGKRLRPLFLLLVNSLYEKNRREALDSAMAIELFHNFTLVHDDIMDASNVRRGKPTVHKKYSTNIAILSGDMMLIKAYQFIGRLSHLDNFIEINTQFSDMAIQICEGQQYDMDFETSSQVTLDEYLKMITNKTAVLLAYGSKLGCMVAGGSKEDQNHLYHFALNFGIAFQIQDDVLDLYGDQEKVGKKIGGDIIQNKKTYLYLKAMELASDDIKGKLLSIYSTQHDDKNEQKIKEVKTIFDSLLVREYANQVIEAYKDLSISHIKACKLSDEKQEILIHIVNKWIFRNH